MFFFGAFSGNLLYLVLVISSLAGCSAMVLRSSESSLKEIKTAEISLSQVLYSNQLSDISTSFYTKVTDHVNPILLKEVAIQPPILPFLNTFFIPPLLAGESHYSGSAHFSRPPPFFLV